MSPGKSDMYGAMVGKGASPALTALPQATVTTYLPS
jgi:hypothetical protein